MKNSLLFLLSFAAIVVTASSLDAAGVPDVVVTISDASGHLNYRGKTDANGVFATQQVPAGTYVIQFKAKDAARRNDYAIFAAAMSYFRQQQVSSVHGG